MDSLKTTCRERGRQVLKTGNSGSRDAVSDN